MKTSKCCNQPEFMPIMRTNICSMCMKQADFDNKKEKNNVKLGN